MYVRLLLPGDLPAPPDALALAGKHVPALTDHPHTLPLHPYHRHEHVALSVIFLRFDLLHRERIPQLISVHQASILKTK